MKIFFLSLGCDKNLVDSEVMLKVLDKEGYQITDDEADADVIVINSCGFISDATQESIDSVIEMAEYKKSGSCKALILTGCMAQRYSGQIFGQLPEIDAIIGVAAYDRIGEVVRRVVSGEREIRLFEPSERDESLLTERVLSTPGYFAYLKIAEGCDNTCTYCTIPSIRGKYKSRTIESLLKEAASLAAMGVKELIIVAQNTGLYGIDLYEEPILHKLLKKLSEIDGIEWLRLLYCYPENITDELIEEMSHNKKVCHYIDMPIQHAHDDILKLMGRKHCSSASIETTINKLRAAMPDISIRTTCIVGFPSESEKHFEYLCGFAEKMRFDKLGVFAYSKEEGTPACNLPNHIDEPIKIRRKDELLNLQRFISLEKNNEKVGLTFKVLVDGKLPEEEVYCGRSYADCYDVDGLIFFDCEYELMAGDFVDVKIIEAAEYDLIGVIVSDEQD